MKPSRIEYDLGSNAHGQPVKLFREGKRWILIRDQANQRDDCARVELTDAQLGMIGAISGEAAGG